MSICATQATWELSKQQVTATEKLFLLSCADRAGEEGICWPSIKRLSLDTCLDRKTIVRVRQSCIDKGLLKYTGERKGRTKSVEVMQLVYISERHEEIISSPKNGTGSSPKNGTAKQSQKRDTESKRRNLKEEPINKEKNKTKKEIKNLIEQTEKMLEKNKELQARIKEQSKEKREDMPQDNHTYPETYYLQDESATHPKQQLVLDDPLNYFDLTTQQKKTFDVFWGLFPRKSGKKRAMLQWFHDGCHLIANEIMEKLKAQVERDQGWKEGYVPSPFNYIVDKRWEDEPWEGVSKTKSIDFDKELESTDWINRV